jgi:16S rRNA (guanine966-N2)-methyltransferase
VERDPALAAQLRATVERLAAAPQVHVMQADALALLRAPLHGRFDIVFLDPPFDAGLWSKAIPLLPGWLADDAWLYVEAPLEAAHAPGNGWLPHREGSTRHVRYSLFRRGVGAATLAAVSPADGATTE